MALERPHIPIDGDNVEIGYVPVNYVPDDATTEAVDDERLAAHLHGIDLALTGGGALPTPTGEGDILFAVTGAAFVAARPIINGSNAQILFNANAVMVVA
jgi:hypothetical protein